jgi:predicted acylesterase/phospholipase RssA
MVLYRHLVISGGAIKSIAVLGCVKYLQEKDMLKNIITYVGTSAGTIMSLLLVCGYSCNEMIDILYSSMCNGDLLAFDINECVNFFQTYGLNSGKNLEILVENILHRKLGVSDITFVELAKRTGKNLVICTSNMTKRTHEFFSVDTHPETSVKEAIRLSCSFPVLYTPTKYKEEYHLDGGIFNNYPLNYFKPNQLEDVLGIHITTYSDYDHPTSSI